MRKVYFPRSKKNKYLGTRTAGVSFVFIAVLKNSAKLKKKTKKIRTLAPAFTYFHLMFNTG
jgi:hypothetical protein